MSPSAIYDLIKGRTKCSKVITVKRFCEGAEITLSEFFDRDYFNDLEEDLEQVCYNDDWRGVQEKNTRLM